MCFATEVAPTNFFDPANPRSPFSPEGMAAAELEAPSITDVVLREQMLTDIRRRRSRQGRQSTFLTGFAGSGGALPTTFDAGVDPLMNLGFLTGRADQRASRPGPLTSTLLGGLG